MIGLTHPGPDWQILSKDWLLSPLRPSDQKAKDATEKFYLMWIKAQQLKVLFMWIKGQLIKILLMWIKAQ